MRTTCKQKSSETKKSVKTSSRGLDVFIYKDIFKLYFKITLKNNL
jgi:hypothetical protein